MASRGSYSYASMISRAGPESQRDGAEKWPEDPVYICRRRLAAVHDAMLRLEQDLYTDGGRLDG